MITDIVEEDKNIWRLEYIFLYWESIGDSCVFSGAYFTFGNMIISQG